MCFFRCNLLVTGSECFCWFSIKLVLMIDGFIGRASHLSVCVCQSVKVCVWQLVFGQKWWCWQWGGVSIWLPNEINRKDVENQDSGWKHRCLCMHYFTLHYRTTLRDIYIYDFIQVTTFDTFKLETQVWMWKRNGYVTSAEWKRS